MRRDGGIGMGGDPFIELLAEPKPLHFPGPSVRPALGSSPVGIPAQAPEPILVNKSIQAGYCQRNATLAGPAVENT